MIRALFAIVILLLTGGCTGQLYSLEGENKTKGVKVYPPQTVIEQYETTMIIDTNGKIIASRDGNPKCTPTVSEKIVNRADYSHPYYVMYDHGFLEKYDFSLTLVEGMLVSVNIKSDPDRGETLKNVVGAAKDAATIAAGADVARVVLACTSVPRLKNIYSSPTITPYPMP